MSAGRDMSRVGVIGAGYVGATTAACLAHLGHDVVCADLNEQLVGRLSNADVPILEAQLPELIREGLDVGRLRFVTDPEEAGRDAEFVFLCVNTPQGENGDADLSYVEGAVATLAPVLAPRTIVVNKSTMPVGSARQVKEWFTEHGASEVRVASNPEFLAEGNAVKEFLDPERIVVGVDEEETAVRLSLLYRRLQARIIVTDPASAEMIKYASNAYLATRISFINSIANLCEAVDADVSDVALGMGYDSRIGFAALKPGPGYGGSCLPKDTAALVNSARNVGFDFEHLQVTRAVNDRQRQRIVEKIRAAAGGALSGANIAVWGLTFKANTDDVRDSPAIDITKELVAEGAAVRAYDPKARREAVLTQVDVEIADEPYAACDGAQVLAVLTEWDEFRWLDFGKVGEVMAGNAVVDARNVLDREGLVRRGFTYEGVGR